MYQYVCSCVQHLWQSTVCMQKAYSTQRQVAFLHTYRNVQYDNPRFKILGKYLGAAPSLQGGDGVLPRRRIVDVSSIKAVTRSYLWKRSKIFFKLQYILTYAPLVGAGQPRGLSGTRSDQEWASPTTLSPTNEAFRTSHGHISEKKPKCRKKETQMAK